MLDDRETLSTDISTGINNLIPTDTNWYQLISTDRVNNLKVYEVDNIYNQLPDLVNHKFRAWYVSRFYDLGKDQVFRLASLARADGKNPQKLFSYLLKKESK
jgi:hypothetical protein